MKRNSYMSKNELLDFLKLGVLSGECARIVLSTPEKDWARKLKCITTYLDKIIKERLFCLDVKQLESVDRRRKHTELMLFTSDERRLMSDDGLNQEENVTIATADLDQVTDMALMACMGCPQGECVEGCKMREVFHRLSVMPLRTNPKTGECEFRMSDEAENFIIDNHVKEN